MFVKNAHKKLYNNSCTCTCCKWHYSSAIRFLLAVLFLSIVVVLGSGVVLGLHQYMLNAITGFIGLILLIGFIGWALSMMCTCKGAHFIHGMESNPMEVARARYARGEINRKEYMQISKDLKE